jgi:hypothetical protein
MRWLAKPLCPFEDSLRTELPPEPLAQPKKRDWVRGRLKYSGESVEASGRRKETRNSPAIGSGKDHTQLYDDHFHA